MPLQQGSTNVPTSASGISLGHKGSASSNPTYERPRAPPLAVQSMLRTTTEMGDVMPSYRSKDIHCRPGLHLQSSRPRSGSFDSSFASAVQHLQSPRYRPRHHHHGKFRAAPDARLSRYDTIQSNLSSYTRAPRNRHTNLEMRHQAITSPRLPSRAIHNHRSIHTLRNHKDVANRHSGSSTRSTNASSWPYHARNSRNAHNGSGWCRRVGNTLDRSRNSTVSSPGLAAGYHSSYGSLTRRARMTSTSVSIPEMSSMDLAARIALDGSQNGINSAPPSIPGVANTALANHESTPSKSACSRPRYYDYSESFLEEYDSMPESLHDFRSHFVSHEVSNPGLSDSIQQTQPACHSLLGSPLFPAELPTEYNLKADMNLVCCVVREEEKSRESGVLQAFSRINLSELPADYENKVDRQNNSPQERFELEANVRRFSAASRRTCASSKSGIFFLNGEKSQRDLPLLVARVHSPDPESSLETNRTEDIRYPFVCDLRNPDILCSDTAVQSSHVLAILASGRPRTSPVEICRSDLEVISPQPERPISSQSRRQFKKIINISEEAKHVTNNPHRDAQRKPRFSAPSMLGIGHLNIRIPDEVLRSEVMTTQGSVQNRGLVLSQVQTPEQMIELSMIQRDSKSTVDLLLENHIKSLGLIPETESVSDSSSVRADNFGHARHNEAVLAVSEDCLHIHRKSQLQPSNASVSRTSSLSSQTRMEMKPRRLFASYDGKITAHPESVIDISKEEPLPIFKRDRPFSLGWQTLPSNSQISAHYASSQPTLMSGEMADIDTDLYPLGCRIWRSSQMSLPTTEEEQLILSPATRVKSHRRRSHSEPSAKQDLQHRRRLKIHIKQQSQYDPLKELIFLPTRLDDPEKNDGLRNSKQFLHATQEADLHSNQVCGRVERPVENHQGDSDRLIPNRWSGIIAAMPMPGTGKPILPKILSGKSQASLPERLNSTRQRSYIPRLGSVIPRLAPPDLGPPLDASTLNLKVPYAEEPSTILPSKRNTQSFFDHSPPSKRVSKKGGRRRFGLRPLQYRTRGSGTAPPSARNCLPMRNGIPIPAVGPGSLNACPGHNMAYRATQTMHSPDLTYPKRKSFGRFKDWWKRQCLHKSITTLRNRKMQPMPKKVFW